MYWCCCLESNYIYVVQFSAFVHVDGLKQDCSNSIADALELLQSVLSHRCNGLTLNRHQAIKTLRPGQDGRHFPDDIFTCIFSNEMYKFRLRFQ